MEYIKSFIFDWFYTNDNGEEYMQIDVRQYNVNAIAYNEVRGYCRVYFDDGHYRTYYNLNQVNSFNAKEWDEIHKLADEKIDNYDSYDQCEREAIKEIYKN